MDDLAVGSGGMLSMLLGLQISSIRWLSSSSEESDFRERKARGEPSYTLRLPPFVATPRSVLRPRSRSGRSLGWELARLVDRLAEGSRTSLARLDLNHVLHGDRPRLA